MEEEMRFISYIKPPLSNGAYKIQATQSVTQPENCEFEEEAEFHVAGHAFVLPKNEVFLSCPADNESGEFGNSLPFLVMENRTFPWENQICAERNETPVPWVALLVVAETEGAKEQDMQIGDLLEKKEKGVYFPDKTRLPKVFAEKETDCCHVLDLPKSLYDAIMPSVEDLPYLCHVRSVNLRKTEDSVCARDGFFSVICGNRFIPSGDGELAKSTVHLVSLLGMGDLSAVPDCETVRLVSLYRWDVFSKKKSEENFAAVVERLRQNCSVLYDSGDTELKRQGYCVKKHMTRTGEETYSLYRPPLVPFLNAETLELESKHTADGLLMYDRKTGLFDVTYAAAWQMGRMLALSHPADAEKIVTFRKTQKQKLHQNCIRASINIQKAKLEKLAVCLAGANSLNGGGQDETNTDSAACSKAAESVFRGYC